MRRTIFLLMTLTAMVGWADDVKFSLAVSCDAPAKDGEGKCTGGLAVAGDTTSMITIKEIPTDGEVTMSVDAGTWIVPPQKLNGKAAVEIPVHTKRVLGRTYALDPDSHTRNDFTTILEPIPSEIYV